MQYPQQAGPYMGAPGVVTDPSGRYGVAMPPGYIGLPGYQLMPGYVQPENAAYGADAENALAQGIERNLGLGSNPQQHMMPVGGQQYAAGPQGYPPAAYQQQQRGYPPASRGPPGVKHEQQEYPPGGSGMGPRGPNGMYHGPPGVQRHPGPMVPNHLGQHSPNRNQPQYANVPLQGPQQGPRGPRGGRNGGDFRPGGPPQQGVPRGGRKVPRGLEDNVKRTVYISYIDQQVTEESLATFFADCGTVMDCRICGDPNSAMRFAFIEFLEIQGAQQALSKTGKSLGTSQLRVLPSKTAIVPVNKELMPRSHEELERCSRTVYVANIDKALEKEDVRRFFEKYCGHIGKIRLLGDLAHSTRIAFIEFIQAESAMAALNCSGALLGSLPLRVSPSKTPVRGDKEDRDALRQQQRRRQKQQQRQQEQDQEGGPGDDDVATATEAANGMGLGVGGSDLAAAAAAAEEAAAAADDGNIGLALADVQACVNEQTPAADVSDLAAKNEVVQGNGSVVEVHNEPETAEAAANATAA